MAKGNRRLGIEVVQDPPDPLRSLDTLHRCSGTVAGQLESGYPPPGIAVNCPKCGATVRETDKFCSECGSTLEAKKSDGPCRACGQMVPLGAKFCGNCGASEPHSVPAGATGETVVARAPMAEGVVPPPTDDADTGVF